jgi:hypothetical protein
VHRPTVVVQKGGSLYKVCKIWFGQDGTYYVTSPYHRARQAMLVKATVNYETGPDHLIPISDLLDVAGLEEGEHLKLSHHPDGLSHFSGKGVYSAKDEYGHPKGVGVRTRALTHVGDGPAFVVTVNALEKFEQKQALEASDIVFDYDALAEIPGPYGFRLEGHYFQPSYRRFVEKRDDGSQWITVIHPSRALLRLRAILAPTNCAIPSVIGLDFFASPIGEGSADYVLSGPGGNLRDNEFGQKVADQISAVFPAPECVPMRRNVDYPQQSIVAD